ncbi:hypothetical protein N0V90_001502 [Kalmusia sp. IMI 367209]|nr:hypothetical protein N0V90_001502 [Kalmusia sp. IMI 367209]
MSVNSVQWSRVIADRLNGPTKFAEEHRAWLTSSSLEDAENKFHELESRMESKKSAKVMQKLRPLLKTFNRFSDLAATLASLEPHGIASLTVGSLKVVVQLASGGIEDFEEIFSFFDEIHGSFEILMINEERLNKHQWNANRLNNALYQVFNAYWAFFEDVYSLMYSIKRHKVRGFWSHAKDYLTFKTEKVKTHLGTIRDYCEAAKEEADLAWKLNQDDANTLLQQSISGLEARMTEQQKILYRQDRLHFKSWLSPVEIDDRMNFILRVRTPDTGNWIFNDAQFRSWAFGDRRGQAIDRPLLWLSAGPGFGKSVLTAFITSYLRRSNATGIAYFPCNSNEADRRSIPAMLRTLIHQLFRDDDMTGNPHYTVTPKNIESQEGLSQPNMTFLVKLFNDKSKEEPHKRTVLIIDALDECLQTEESEVQMKQLFTLLAGLPPNWKILFTSRRAPWFEEMLEDIPQEKLDGPQLSTKTTWKQHERHWIKFPSDLKGIYEQALRRLARIDDEFVREDLFRALRWILRAYRPFKVEELAIGLAQAFEDIDKVDNLREKLERHAGDLLYIDANTDTVGLTHTSARDFLLVSHDIKGPDGKPIIPEQLEEVDLEMLQACLIYLRDRQFLEAQPGGPETQKAFKDYLTSEGFYEYACIGLMQHLEEVCRTQQPGEELEDLLDIFFRSDKNQVFLRWLQMFCYLRFTNRNGAAETYYTLLNTLIDADSGTTKPLAQFLKQKYHGIMEHLGYSAGGRFLRWERFFTHANSPCFSPTLLASFFNFREALESLAQGGEVLHYKKSGARSDAVFWSASGDAPDTLALMLSDDYRDRFPRFRDATDGRPGRPSPMLEAVFLPREIMSRKGTYPAAIILLDHGAHISWGFESVVFEQTPDSEGAGQLAERMLRIPRAFTFSDDAVGRALHFAAFCGHFHILSVFLKNQDLLRNIVRASFSEDSSDAILKDEFQTRANLADSQWRGMGPMHLAAANNDGRSVLALCRNLGNLDTMPCAFNEWSIMHLAAMRGLERLGHSRDRHNDWTVTRQPIDPRGHTVEILDKLLAGTDWSALDSAGNLPIHLAAYCGCDEIIQILSNEQNNSEQYEWDKTNHAGKTPLAIALELNYLTVAETLIRNGASLQRVPQNLRNPFIFRNLDTPQEVSIGQKKPFWLELACIIRAKAKQRVPLPIIAHILKLGDIYETLTVERRDHYMHTELIRDLIYLRSQPILTSSSATPVRRVTLAARSYRQDYTDHDFAKTWSWLRTDKIESTSERLLPWNEKPIWRWNYRKRTEETVVYSSDKAEDVPYLKALASGDRICIIPVPTYAAWEANIEWARISIEMSLIRDSFSNQDRQNIWKPRKAVRSLQARQLFDDLSHGKQKFPKIPHRNVDDGSAPVYKLPKRRIRG